MMTETWKAYKEAIKRKEELQKELKEADKLIQMAVDLCTKFIMKVQTGRARSKETYAECTIFIKAVADSERNRK